MMSTTGAYFRSDELEAIVDKEFMKNTIEEVCKDHDGEHHSDEIKKLIPHITFNVSRRAPPSSLFSILSAHSSVVRQPWISGGGRSQEGER